MSFTQRELAILDLMAEKEDGEFCEGCPPTGIMGKLAERGLVDTIEPDGGWLCGQFRITEAGRRAVRSETAPVGEW